MRVMLKLFLGFIWVIILTSCTSKKGIEGNNDNTRADKVKKVNYDTSQTESKKRDPLDIIKQVQPGKTLEFIKQYLGAPHEKDMLTLKDKNNNEKYQVNRFFYNLDNMNVMVGFIDGEVSYASFEIKNYDEKFGILHFPVYTFDSWYFSRRGAETQRMSFSVDIQGSLGASAPVAAP